MSAPNDHAALDLALSVGETRRAHGRTVPTWLWGVVALGVVAIWTVGLWPALFGACGLGAVLGFGASVAKARASQSWPRVTAVVTENRLHRGGMTSDGVGGTTHYRPLATYAYEVDGALYTGLNLEEVASTPNRVVAEQALETEWAVGREVEIAVDPADPFRHTLRPGDVGGVLRGEAWLVLVGLAFLGAAVVLYLS